MANNTIFETLIRFNSKTQMKGFKYTERAIEIVLNNPEEYKDCLMITKSLYPSIAKEFNSASTRVERCMRHYISEGYDHNPAVFHLNGFDYKPTNSNFISNIAMYITRNKTIV